MLPSSGLIVNVDKTIKCNRCPLPTYKEDHVQFVESFKYLGIYVPLTNKWNCVWFESRLKVGWKSYYTLENRCN